MAYGAASCHTGTMGFQSPFPHFLVKLIDTEILSFNTESKRRKTDNQTNLGWKLHCCRRKCRIPSLVVPPLYSSSIGDLCGSQSSAEIRGRYLDVKPFSSIKVLAREAILILLHASEQSTEPDGIQRISWSIVAPCLTSLSREDTRH